MKRVVSIIVCVVLIIISFICGFFIGRIGMKEEKKSEETDAKSMATTVGMNESYKLTLLEFKLKRIEFSKKICTYTSHENYLFDANKDNELKEHNTEYLYTDKAEAGEGYIYATIEYTLKNISNEKVNLKNIDATSRFKFLYDNAYSFEDNRTNTGLNGYNNTGYNAFIKKNKYWEAGDTVYLLNPLSEEVTVRETILVPEKVANDKDKSLVLIKEFSNSNSLVEFERESVYIKIR